MSPAERAAQIRRLEDELGTALAAYRRDKRQFDAVTQAYADRYPDPVTAEFKAAVDPRLTNAITYGAFHRDEVKAFGTALAALLAAQAADLTPDHVRRRAAHA
jgi:hypothetical protein